MRKLIARYIAFPLQDLVRGTRVIQSHKELIETQKLSKDKLLELQFYKLKKIIYHAYSKVEYYKELFDSINLKPEDIKCLNDIKKIPITDKQMARDAGPKLYGISGKEKNIKYGKTGGTTGVPLHLKKDTQTRSVGWGAFFRWYSWMGINREDSIVSLWGAPSVVRKNLKQKVYNRFKHFFSNGLVINSFNINQETLPRIVKLIANKKPVIIRGYLSALLQLAYYIEENNIKTISPKAVSPTTETLLPPYRALLERVFGCPVYDQYGCGECGSIAFECEKHEGLHITSEHCMVEIIDDNNQDAGFEIGDIVVTDLDNFAMPFIRYKIGDRARLLDKTCSCGRELPLLSEICGRSADTITLKNGSKVHGVFFTDIFGELNFIENKEIKRFQAYQQKAGNLELRIESDKKMSKGNENILNSVLMRHFNNITISYHKKLQEDSSGKFRYIISNCDV